MSYPLDYMQQIWPWLSQYVGKMPLQQLPGGGIGSQYAGGSIGLGNLVGSPSGDLAGNGAVGSGPPPGVGPGGIRYGGGSYQTMMAERARQHAMGGYGGSYGGGMGGGDPGMSGSRYEGFWQGGPMRNMAPEGGNPRAHPFSGLPQAQVSGGDLSIFAPPQQASYDPTTGYNPSNGIPLAPASMGQAPAAASSAPGPGGWQPQPGWNYEGPGIQSRNPSIASYSEGPGVTHWGASPRAWQGDSRSPLMAGVPSYDPKGSIESPDQTAAYHYAQPGIDPNYQPEGNITARFSPYQGNADQFYASHRNSMLPAGMSPQEFEANSNWKPSAQDVRQWTNEPYSVGPSMAGTRPGQQFLQGTDEQGRPIYASTPPLGAADNAGYGGGPIGQPYTYSPNRHGGGGDSIYPSGSIFRNEPYSVGPNDPAGLQPFTSGVPFSYEL